MAERRKATKGKGAKAKANAPAKTPAKKRAPRKPRKRAEPKPPSAKDRAAVQAAAAKDGQRQRGPDPGMTEEERRQRDLEIFRGALRGLDTPTLAATYDLTAERVREIVLRQRREVTFLQGMTPNDFVDWYLQRLDALIAQVAAEVARTKSVSERTNAISKQADLMREQFRTLQQIGVLPEDLGKLRSYMDAVQLAKGLRRLMEKWGLGEKELSELREILPVEMTQSDDHPALEAAA